MQPKQYKKGRLYKMEYNQKRQPYEVTNTFRVLETGEGIVEYCRVKFMYTAHEQVVSRSQIKTGEFEDESLVELAEEIEALLGVEEEPTEVYVAKIIATDRDGNEYEVEDLEAFCVEHELDIEAVQAVLEGKQKTHRKFKFKLA